MSGHYRRRAGGRDGDAGAAVQAFALFRFYWTFRPACISLRMPEIYFSILKFLCNQRNQLYVISITQEAELVPKSVQIQSQHHHHNHAANRVHCWT